MAGRAIGAKSGFSVDARFRIHVPGMGEIEQDRPGRLEARERKQLVGARRERAVALSTDHPIDRSIEIGVVA
jgi:hypothetical protein